MAKKKKKKRLPDKLQAWVEARRRYHLSHAQVQMARELGMNPKKLGGMANHRQQKWKMPLPQYIEHLYYKRFGRERPEKEMSIEERHGIQRRKKEARKAARVVQRVMAEAAEKKPSLHASDSVDPEEDEIPFEQAPF